MRKIEGCSVAVVGGAGFLGSHLVDYLVEQRRCNVLAVDNLVVGRREWVHPKATFAHHDITESESHLCNLFKEFNGRTSLYLPFYVLNYCAFPYIPDSFVRPGHVANVNFMGAIKCINAAQEAGAQGILQVSSAEIYGEGSKVQIGEKSVRDDDFSIDEDSLVRPHSTYGAAKAAVDYYCQSAWRERKTPVIALRQFNCCGERESHPYVIPEIIGQLDHHRATYASAGLEGDNVDNPTIRLGNNSARDFMYAGDAVRLAVELLERGSFGECYNLGSESNIKIYDLAKLIGKLMGFADVQVIEDESRKRPWEIWSLLSDNTKLYKAIGRTPSMMDLEKTSLDEALKRTIAWYKANGSRWPWEGK